MEQISLHVNGMSCGHCVRAIEENVGGLKGVEAVKVHLESGKVDVTFDSDKIALKDIVQEIEDQGYDVAEQ
ncbi:copper chaperone CopZ [Bacillus sp. CLL-7-23]|uniref:Copper chaperone CopZ n=1 Tax=Bacillus changyiensis TaxID=3004103 RepID=A0ABT4X6S0_9BACI|nr:copper chaperone CopZ [Bacillus changyiensis]MDA7027434.1 copper chaperone CopZ [Bacillus changyiensis]